MKAIDHEALATRFFQPGIMKHQLLYELQKLERDTVRLTMETLIARMEVMDGNEKLWSYGTILAYCKKVLEHPCEILRHP
jgi:hypothetical protein